MRSMVEGAPKQRRPGRLGPPKAVEGAPEAARRPLSSLNSWDLRESPTQRIQLELALIVCHGSPGGGRWMLERFRNTSKRPHS